MTVQPSQIARIFSEWILGGGVLIATSLAATGTHTFLKHLHKNHKWQFLRILAPSVSNLLYIIGLKLATEVAPLNSRTLVWVDGTVYVLAVFIFLHFIQKSALLGIEWSFLKENSSETLRKGFIPLLRNIITLFVFLTGVIMVLKHFNYDVMSLVTALGVGSLAVGLAAKDTLSNMISGFILIIDRNLRPGDRINLTGMIGDVEEIGLRSTQIKMGDGNTLIVPNSELVNTKILNLSIPTREISCSLSIRVPYSIPFSKIKTICLGILNQVNYASKTRKGWVNLASLANGYQAIDVGFWVSEMNEAGAAVSEFNELLLLRFQQEGIPLVQNIT